MICNFLEIKADFLKHSAAKKSRLKDSAGI
jgi:hypothetical protein